MTRFSPLLVALAATIASAANAQPHSDNNGVRAHSAQPQHGGNTLCIRQVGDDHSAFIAQTGDDNRLRLIQLGDGESIALTQGGAEKATIVQGSPGNGDPRRSGMQRYLNGG